ncbi:MULTISPECIES: hypothetical protein [Leptospira]|uniref:Uncharacterized protein n=6 Tax=Leptospira santarosai TaxID=28183 RepID=A0A0G8BJ51_9LEPT|nr:MULTISPECIES: hypothetical protein [Leptospira]EMO59625.1 hypothetical protein LEP1GSC161_3703 [Leptospira santarosai str. CBC1416]ASV11543.1 hypothetical protein B2G51_07030 [Leptospira santarosai]AVQ11117.1 Uncharacterized protein XB16_0778 [Leptospira santarosai]AVV49718.1 Uncharacterized protein XB17_01121 [Leptospira santarosai]AVV80154.1 Uncharacterized protein XB15_02405 [Leptospira santarosai]
MKSITILGNLAESENFGPDPVILRKRGMPVKKRKFEDYKKKLEDPSYIDFAIDKIAMEISHFLSK